MALHIGSIAPDFEQDSTEGRIRFHEWLGDELGRAVLAPEGLHARVHDGARPRRQAQGRVRPKRNVKIIALSASTTCRTTSAGSATSRRRRARKIDFPILADADRKVAKLYDMIHPEANDTLTVRSVFFIDPNKKIRADHHLPGQHRPQLQRDPARHRLAAAHRQPPGRDAGRLEGRRRRRHRAGAEGSGSAGAEVSQGLERDQTLLARDPPTE